MAKFKADPSRVSITVKKLLDGGKWRICVFAEDGSSYCTDCPDSQVAVEVAMERAISCCSANKFPGLDYNMQGTYDHPWKDAK